jgi:hypothetical protein
MPRAQDSDALGRHEKDLLLEAEGFSLEGRSRRVERTSETT